MLDLMKFFFMEMRNIPGSNSVSPKFVVVHGIDKLFTFHIEANIEAIYQLYLVSCLLRLVS